MSAVSPGADAVESSQHQSNQKKSTPWRSNGAWSAKYELSWRGFVQSNTSHCAAGSAIRMWHWPFETRRPPELASVAGHRGSRLLIDGWMLSVSASPCACAQSTKRCGSGNRVGFHSHPFQL